MWSLYFPPDCKQLIKKRNVGHVVIHVSASANTRISLIVFMSPGAICYLLHMYVHSGYHKQLILVITAFYKSQTRGNKVSTYAHTHTHTNTLALAVANTARKSCLGDCYRHEQIDCLIKASQIRLIQLIHRFNQRKLQHSHCLQCHIHCSIHAICSSCVVLYVSTTCTSFAQDMVNGSVTEPVVLMQLNL